MSEVPRKLSKAEQEQFERDRKAWNLPAPARPLAGDRDRSLTKSTKSRTDRSRSGIEGRHELEEN